MNRRNPRYITRVTWQGNHVVTQRFRVKTQPFELMRVKPARFSAGEIACFAAGALLWTFACFLLTLELMR